MKKLIKIVVIVLLVALLIPVGFVLYLVNFKPDIAAPDITVEITPERLQRGEYLANHVNNCMDCHSHRDWTKFSAPPIAGTLGMGGERFDHDLGFPGVYYSPNITPFGLKDWTDGQIYRAITSGVGKNGRPLFPVMPYHYYGQLDDEDVYSLIAYVRNLPEVENTVPAPETDFPMNIILHTIPHKGTPTTRPSKDDLVNYGKYTATAAGCIECHTQVEKGQVIPDLAYGGGREFKMPFGILRTPNITPDVETGIGNWTKEMFIEKFKSYDPAWYEPPTVKEDEYNTIMPWMMFAGMDTTDLEAIYAYLRTVKPMKNLVEKVKLYKE
jgi:hypothetical protein